RWTSVRCRTHCRSSSGRPRIATDAVRWDRGASRRSVPAWDRSQVPSYYRRRSCVRVGYVSRTSQKEGLAPMIATLSRRAIAPALVVLLAAACSSGGKKSTSTTTASSASAPTSTTTPIALPEGFLGLNTPADVDDPTSFGLNVAVTTTRDNRPVLA